ncbi:LOW QUALITY PROTEIN: senescence-associated carboxylesterase 101-like [Hibiscus syriacus]|uniref:LOW QUALITY PROTEIN: senescence-associated carboxylesterase 101-like n=1 Tax=Hibiscus syriacus TaxID=106335 RepID=UPI001922E62F|nr:LOW QUALITY PROTEIN: senescence-associated carboxylesterase 101-like [Hibiscus syriacus]
MNQHLFCSGLEVASFIVSSGLLRLSWAKILDCYVGFNQNEPRNSGFSLRWKCYAEANVNVIVFITSPICTKSHLQNSKESIPSTANKESFRVFEFLCNNGNSFCIHKAAISLFDDHFDELLQLKTQCGRSAKPLILTGNSLGGSIASLFTLWVLESLDISTVKRPLCLTFGSPLLGDKGFQQAISQHPTWNSCFLHVAATSKDSIPGLFIVPSHYLNSAIEASKYGHYKPFGTFLLCCENGCACSENPEAVSEVLMLFRTEAAANEERTIDVYGRIVEQFESVIIRQGISQLGKPMLSSLQAGTTLLIEAIRTRKEQNHQQKSNELDNLIKKLEELEVTCMLNKRKVFDPAKKLNDMKIKMAFLEWYKKCDKVKEIGYYDFYKNRSARSDHDITKHKKFLTKNWEKIVAQAEKKPQKQLVHLESRWLYSGTTCRRMIEPLDIADYYRNGGRNYVTNGRPHHYIKLEQWLEEDERQSGVSVDSKQKQSVDVILTYDSCFWAQVEEARIRCKSMEAVDIEFEERESSRQKLKEFEAYVMEQINKSAVSSEIFLKGSSFMQWWKEYEKIMEPDYNSPLTNFVKNSKFLQYGSGCLTLD